jgi:hypothetical protein
LGNQSLLIETKEKSYLLKHGFFDENVIALKLDSTDNYIFFVNETKFHKELNTINDILVFLENKYLKTNHQQEKNEFKKYSNIKDGIIPNYSKDEPVIRKDIFGVVRYTIFIHFENSISDFYWYYEKSKKYSYQKNKKGEVFFTNEFNCINDLYNDRIKHSD